MTPSTSAAAALLRAAATAAVLLLASCGIETSVTDVGEAPRTSEPTTPTAGTDAGAGAGVEVTVFWTGDAGLVPATRTVADRGDLQAAAADAVRALLEGPSAAERTAGLGSEIPAGTRLLAFELGPDRLATVDLSGEFETGGGSASMQSRLGQLACTVDGAVALDVADGMVLHLDGEPVEVFSGEGIVLDGPLSCADFQPRPTRGEPSPRCIDGWTAPEPGTTERAAAMDLLRASLGTSDRFVVEDIRHFTGPDDPGTIEPVRERVERWYVKARLESDPSVRGRFLVVRRGGSGGVVAVAPYASTGYESPDWAGFEGGGEPVAYPDLPGRWGGIRYDHVTGAGGPGQPGLPDEVVACLADT